MNNKVVYNLHYAFHKIGFTCLRFNFRGVGRSQGEYDQGIGELVDAAAALDYLQAMNPNAKHCWVAGFSLRRLDRHAAADAAARRSPASSRWRRRRTSTTSRFLAPCPSSGLIISGSADRVVPAADVDRRSPTSSSSRRASPSPTTTIEGASHFFDPGMDEMIATVDDYVRRG